MSIAYSKVRVAEINEQISIVDQSG